MFGLFAALKIDFLNLTVTYKLTVKDTPNFGKSSNEIKVLLDAHLSMVAKNPQCFLIQAYDWLCD